MGELITARAALGDVMMRAARQQDVIAKLACMHDTPPSARRRWYREWCVATGSKCRRDELARVAPGLRKQQQLLLEM